MKKNQVQHGSESRIDRLRSAYRRVGLRGLLRDLRWRFREASGGRGVFASMASGFRILRQGGSKTLVDRMRFGVKQFLTLKSGPAHQPAADPWTTSFAYDAAFHPHFDLDADTLAANRRVVQAFESRSDRVSSATWFLTYFEHALFGGVHTILRLMDYMARRHGVAHRLVVFDRPEATDAEIREAVTAAFPSLESIDIVLPKRHGISYDELPYTDIAVCTMWISAFSLARFNKTGAKFYMVQDYEPAFYQAGTLSALAEATYRLGFAGIVNTPGLESVFSEYGGSSISFVPCVDPHERRPRKSELANSQVQVVVYGRPSTPRNAFELIASASVLTKQRYGEKVKIVSAGEQWDPAALGLDGVIENLGLLRSLEDVRALYANSDIGLSLMLSKHPSYQPFEYLASGVAPVCNKNTATEWMLRDGVNCLIAEPYPTAIADAVGRLIDDSELRRSIVDAGFDLVTSRSWDDEFEAVWAFITGR